MKTCCPHCETILTFNQQQIAQRNGMVRCGVCRQVFNALEHLYEEDYPVLSEDEPAQAPSSSYSAEHLSTRGEKLPINISRRQDITQQRTVSPVRSSFTDEKESNEASYQREVLSTPINPPRESMVPPAVHIHVNNGPQHTLSRSNLNMDDDEHYIGSRHRDDNGGYRDKEDDFVVKGDAYEFDEEFEAPRSSFGLFWIFIILLALVLIAGQLLYVFRNQISTAYPAMRPVLLQMCSIVKCEVDIQKSVNNLALENVVVSLNDKVAPQAGEQALRLQALLVNKTEKPQEWPVLVLRLKNKQGVVVNSKNIQPKEYLVPELLMQPFAGGAKQVINLPFVLEGEAISGYELSVFYP